MDSGIVNWNDAAGKRVTVGPIDATWTNLGVLVGTQRIGVRRVQVAPGGRSTPAHVHSGEEEIFYVLAGSGLSWQAGSTCHVGTGDCLVHLIEGAAHTLIAGDEGLDVLAFGERVISESAFLPRANVAWVGPTWVRAGDSPHPFAQEAAAGEIEVPEPGERPSTVVATSDVNGRPIEKGECVFEPRDLGGAAGAQRTALRHVAIAAGHLGYPPHCHSGAEELFVVLEGDGVYLDQPAGSQGWEPAEHPVEAGAVVAAVAGTGVAHAFRAGPKGLTLLAYGNRDTNDMIWYPRSGKIAFNGLRVVGRVDRVSYWEGEE